MAVERFSSSKPFPFSDIVKANGFIFLSGQVSMTQEGDPVERNTVAGQTQRIMDAIDTTLPRAGALLNDVLRVQVWLSDMAHFTEFNAAYSSRFAQGFPARSVVTSRLAFGLNVEIEVQAVEPCLIC